MKILFHHRIASADGQFVHLTELCKALRKEGCKVDVVGPSLQADSAMGETDGFIGSLKKALPKGIYELLEFAYTGVAAIRLYKACRELKPDAIYERYNLHLHAGRFVAAWFKIPFILEINAPLVWERSTYAGLALKHFASWSEGSSWRAADITLPVTNVLADYVRQAGVPEDRICVIPNGADIDLYPKSASKEIAKESIGLQGQTVLGFVGFIRDWHGLSDIIKWMAGANCPKNIALILVGDGPDREKLQKLSYSLGVNERVKITGFVSREAIPAYIQSFDIALQPAVTPYASPLKLFEYMAAGCAIVSTGTPNMKEVLIDNDNALLVDPLRPADFGEKVKYLVNNPDVSLRLGNAARQLVEQHPYTWQGNAKTVVSLIKQLQK